MPQVMLFPPNVFLSQCLLISPFPPIHRGVFFLNEDGGMAMASIVVV